MMIAYKSGLKQVRGFLQIYRHNICIFLESILTKLCVTNTYRFMERYRQMKLQWGTVPCVGMQNEINCMNEFVELNTNQCTSHSTIY